MAWLILNIKFILIKIICRFLKIDLLKITEPPIPEVPYPYIMDLIKEE
jgi:hypothetical protein